MEEIKIILVFFLLAGFTSGTVLDVEEFQAPWDNLLLGKETEQNLCLNGEGKCLGNLQRPDNLNLFESDTFLDKRGQSRLVEFGNIYSCSCGMDRRLMDLGQSYFPRYILTGKCQLTCRAGFQKCRPKHYPVVVLKMKSFEDGGLNTSVNVMHSKLKDSWVAEKINVVVGCECGP